jgi:hypothetical protein
LPPEYGTLVSELVPTPGNPPLALTVEVFKNKLVVPPVPCPPEVAETPAPPAPTTTEYELPGVTVKLFM